MPIVIGLWLALAGGVALLAGVTAMRRVDRLRLRGMAAWATVVRVPYASHDADDDDRALLQYTIADGRVLQQTCPPPVRKARAMIPGEKVQVWYAPADPADVVVSGRDGRSGDWAFALAGILLLLAGVWIAGR